MNLLLILFLAIWIFQKKKKENVTEKNQVGSTDQFSLFGHFMYKHKN